MLKIEQIHHTSYLLGAEIDLSELDQYKTEIFDLKQGYEILSLSVEVTEAGVGTLDLGTVEATDLFLNDIDVGAKDCFKSKIETTIQDDTSLVLDTTARAGKVKIRMFFFTPSKMLR